MPLPKRKYTLTAKALAANRANLVKARAVAKEIRFRETPKRLAACRANLLKAHRGRHQARVAEADGPGYGTCFRLGLHAVSLKRSLELAGESGAEYEAHLERFDRAFAPVDAVGRRLVRGMAETVWRRLRALGGQARWELCAMAYRLEEAARDPRLGGYTETMVDRDHVLADEIQGIFTTDCALMEALPKLNQRLERLARVWSEKHYPGEPRLEVFTHPRASERWLLERPMVVLHNPFV
jgi:hypothetical protein